MTSVIRQNDRSQWLHLFLMTARKMMNALWPGYHLPRCLYCIGSAGADGLYLFTISSLLFITGMVYSVLKYGKPVGKNYPIIINIQ
jgi:hypothetical protein